MTAPRQPEAAHHARTLMFRAVSAAAAAALFVAGLVLGYLLGSVTFYWPPVPLVLAGVLVIWVRTLSGPKTTPLLWGAAVGLCIPFLLMVVLSAGSLLNS